MAFSDKVRRLARKLHVRPTDDPDSVTAVLQIGKRLISEGWTQGVNRAQEPETGKVSYCSLGALDAAVPMAAPKDAVRTWWAAHRALTGALPSGFRDIAAHNDDINTQREDVAAVWHTAGINQGALNVFVAKGSR